MSVSIITPVYNVKEYLNECVESVLGQSQSDTEIVLIDDGSTDGSEKICEKYADMYPEQVKVIRTNNYGPLHARCEGIEQASGEILIFLDSDDCLRSDAIRTIVQSFKDSECDMVLFDAGINGPSPSLSVENNLEANQVYDEDTKKIIYKKIIEGKIPNSVCLKAVRRECAVFSKELAKHKMIHGEDLLMSVAFITNCKKIFYLKEGLYQYRIRGGSTTNFFDVNRHESLKFVHTEVEKYIEKWGMPEIKSLHNARRVKGWIDNIILMTKNRKLIGQSVFVRTIINMAKDKYFRNSYKLMDKKAISFKYRTLAFLLYYLVGTVWVH